MIPPQSAEAGKASIYEFQKTLGAVDFQGEAGVPGSCPGGRAGSTKCLRDLAGFHNFHNLHKLHQIRPAKRSTISNMNNPPLRGFCGTHKQTTSISCGRTIVFCGKSLICIEIRCFGDSGKGSNFHNLVPQNTQITQKCVLKEILFLT